MPTVILLDVSLSMAMSRTQQKPLGDNEYSNSSVQSSNNGPTSDSASDSHANNCSSITKKALAVHCIYKFLDYLGQQARLEYVSLVIYSSLYEVVVPFTRDYDQIKSAADSISLYNKSCLYEALIGAHEVIQSMWGTNTPCQVVIITDGWLDASPDLQSKLTSLSCPAPCITHMICLTAPEEFCCSSNTKSHSTIMNIIGGDVFYPEGNSSFSTVDALTEKFVKTFYQLYSGILSCGNLSSKVQLFPPPSAGKKEDDFCQEEVEFPHHLKIVGFISQSDIKTPACISRHLVLPLPEKSEFDGEVKTDDGKSASFAVLLHGALKVESYVALVSIREDWFGILHSWADSKKKSNLVLSVFKPGLESVPWLGNFALLGNRPLEKFSNQQQSPGLPVQVLDKKSYSNLSPSWLRQSSLQTDVQKLLRYGRKLPDKLGIFYKELNRIHKTAISIGFFQLLAGLAQMLERECTLLPATAHPEAAMQLQHAASLLSNKDVLNIHYIIQPLNTNFKSMEN